ncbi:MAG: nucleotide sugar dehydrogenase [Acidobacteria bacterium]|nr:nucleotide sugar dehydrogenase [Acidobacteriota bacterium]
MEFVRAGFVVTGIDLDQRKLEAIRQGKSYIQDVSPGVLREAVRSKKFLVTSDYGVIADLDTISICVPTPLRKTKDPDISYVLEATENIKAHVHRDMLLVLESTTYPGTTDEILLPAVKNFVVGKEIFVAFSPERVDPGNTKFNTHNTPKIIGGATPGCTKVACALYSQAIERVIPVSSTTCAEMVKLLENTFRAVNIGLVNELAIMCDKLNVPVWEVIEAAATKPFGFMPFYPGPGLGGHCIPVDPLYLSWKLKTLNYTARFIELASEINTHMPDYVVTKIGKVLNRVNKCLKGSAVLIVGVAYKRDVEDVRESPALDIIRLLKEEGARLQYTDPYVPTLAMDGGTLKSVPLEGKTLRNVDIAVIVTNHSKFNYRMIFKKAPLILDTRNAITQSGDHVYKL